MSDFNVRDGDFEFKLFAVYSVFGADLLNASIGDGLFESFSWGKSREGYEFWNDQYHAGKLTPEGRKSLEEMLAMWDATEPKTGEVDE